MPIHIYIDADACPVKDETYKVAARYGLTTFVVSNSLRLRNFGPRSDASGARRSL